MRGFVELRKTHCRLGKTGLLPSVHPGGQDAKKGDKKKGKRKQNYFCADVTESAILTLTQGSLLSTSWLPDFPRIFSDRWDNEALSDCESLFLQVDEAVDKTGVQDHRPVFADMFVLGFAPLFNGTYIRF